MEKILRLLQEASKAFRTAENLSYFSYPILMDNKVLLSIANQLYIASLNGVYAVLHYEKLNKRLSILPFDSKLRMEVFEKDISERIGVDPNFSNVVNGLREIVEGHRESVVEFSRGDSFLICNQDYSNIKSLNIELLKAYSYIIRNFLARVNGMVKNV